MRSLTSHVQFDVFLSFVYSEIHLAKLCNLIFFRELFTKPELSEYKTNIAYLDEDYKSEDQYTVSFL